MRLDLPDLRCAACKAAIHPFVSTCPACGAPVRSLADEARRDPDLGAAALLTLPELGDDIRSVVNFYRFRSGGVEAGTGLDEGLAIAFGVVDYRVESGNAVMERAVITLEGGTLTIRDRGGRVNAPILLPVWLILGAAAGRGRLTIHRAEGAPIVISNRRGLMSTKPRPVHYEVLERWLAPLVAAAAERRWTAIGVDAHARELGLAGGAAGTDGATDRAPSGHAAEATPTSRAAEAARPAGAGVPDDGAAIATALRALDALRADGLVSDEEFADKRREILGRL